MAVSGALLSATLLMVAGGLFGGTAHAANAMQCDGIGDGGGQGIECQIEVVNYLDNTNPAAPVASSTYTLTSCIGDANAAGAGQCSSSGAITSGELVQLVDQCNYAVNGGGSTLACSVNITNYITGSGTAVPVSVNQCNASLDTGDVFNCNPFPASTDPSTATIIQCNDSDNGGGSVLDCSVASGSTTSDVVPVTVNQCNNSANGGGSTVFCSVSITNIITVVVPPPVDNPPVDNPPVDNPPVDNPPVDNPPVDNPPVDTPPVVDDGTSGVTEVPPIVPPTTEVVESVTGPSADRLAETGAEVTDLGGVALTALLLGITVRALIAIRRSRAVQ